MTASMTLQSKISKTKKRLSDTSWYLPIIILASIGLMVTLSFLLRATSMAGKYGIVTSEIPLVSVPFDQSSEVGNTINTLTVETTTPVIVLTKNRFIFGDLDAFTTNIDSLRNKFSVSHVDGAPDLLNLIKDIEKWLFGRASRSNISSQGLGILIPQGEIPTPIVIQTIQSLKASKHFEKIVLGSGFQ